MIFPKIAAIKSPIPVKNSVPFTLLMIDETIGKIFEIAYFKMPVGPSVPTGTGAGFLALLALIK